MALFAYPFVVDRETGTINFNFEYFIPAYIDPETGETFDQTKWTMRST